MAEAVYQYFDLARAVETHRFIILNTGGMSPIIVKEGALGSILHHVQDDLYYPNFVDKVAFLVFGLNKGHVFNDGNKRASLALSSLLLELNDHDEAVRKYTYGMEEAVVWVAKSFIDKELLTKIIEFLLYEDETTVASFVAEAKKYRSKIEPHNAPIQGELLSRMVREWLSDEAELSEETKIAVLEAIDPARFSGQLGR